jgi:hypothetical protein
MLARGYKVRHSVSLRMPIDVLNWLIAKSADAELPVATYTVKRLKELARKDLVQREVVGDGDLRVAADD